MKLKHTICAALASVALMGATSLEAASVNIMTEAGQDHSTYHGIRDDSSTRGGDLIGMEVSAMYADGSMETLTWGSIRRTFGVIGSGLQLTFKSSDWVLSTTSLLKSLTINAMAVDSMFDILRMSDGDTATTGRGLGFVIRDGNTHDGNIDVTYSNRIRYRNSDYEGDTFTEMTVDFSGLAGGGLLGDLAFETDLDTLRVSGDLSPVPLPGGLPLLASGALLLGFARRMKR